MKIKNTKFQYMVRIFQGILLVLLVQSGVVSIIGSGSGDEESSGDKLEVTLTTEVQVLDSATHSLPYEGETVYIRTFKCDCSYTTSGPIYWSATFEGDFKMTAGTDADGWASRYVGYNLHDSNDCIVVYASVNDYLATESNPENVEYDYTIISYDDVKQMKQEGSSHVAMTKSLFLYK